MALLRPYDLQHQAQKRLQQAAYDPKRLVLLHTSVAVGASLLVTALNFLLTRWIADTGGLSGLPLRTVLSTIQSVLELAVMTVLPFWEIGLLFAALMWAKKEGAYPRDLFQGFRRFGGVLRLRLLQVGLFLALGIAVSQISTVIFMLTPFAKPLLAIFEPLLENPGAQQDIQALMTPALMEEMVQASIPFVALFGALYALVAVPLFYRLRFAKFCVMEGSGAIMAMLESARLTRKKCLQLLKVDLSFWGFYLLQVLSVAICYADTVLTELGIALPFSEDVGFFMFYAAGMLCQGILLWQFQAKVLTTYCLTYDTFRECPIGGKNNVPWQA